MARVHVPGDALMYATGPEHRDDEELGRIAVQLSGIPVYLNHPTVFPAKDSGQKIVGYVESGRVDEDTAVARIIVTDNEALDAIKSGTYELSLGYACVLDGNRYQRNIQLDHLAIVDRARCGPSCSMRTDMLVPEDNMKVGTLELEVKVTGLDELKEVIDAATMCATCDKPKSECSGHEEKADNSDCACKNQAMPHTNEEMSTKSDNTPDLTAEYEALKAELTKAQEALTALEVEATNARKDADKLKADLEAAQAEIEKVKSDAVAEATKAKTDADDFVASELKNRVDARVALILEASQFKLDGDITKLSDREIKVAVIKHVDGDEVPADKPDAFVDGVYYGALKRGARAEESRSNTRVAINEMRKDGAVLSGKSAEEAAKQKMARESTEAWKKNSK